MKKPEEKELSMQKLLQEMDKQLNFQDEFIKKKIQELHEITGLPQHIVKLYLEK